MYAKNIVFYFYKVILKKLGTCFLWICCCMQFCSWAEIMPIFVTNWCLLGEQFVVLDLPLLFESGKMIPYINTIIVVNWYNISVLNSLFFWSSHHILVKLSEKFVDVLIEFVSVIELFVSTDCAPSFTAYLLVSYPSCAKDIGRDEWMNWMKKLLIVLGRICVSNVVCYIVSFKFIGSVKWFKISHM